MRDAAEYIERFIDQVTTLDHPPERLRFVACEGDSADWTWSRLERWAEGDSRVTLVKCNTGKPKFGSVVDPERFQVLATVFNAALDAVDYGWSDFVLFVPADILFRPDLLAQLLLWDTDIVAPFVYHAGTGRFYDTWAFSRGGQNFPPFTVLEAFTLFIPGRPVKCDTVGGTVLIDADVLRSGVRYAPSDVDRGLCRAARANGHGRIWADPGTVVFHL